MESSVPRGAHGPRSRARPRRRAVSGVAGGTAARRRGREAMPAASAGAGPMLPSGTAGRALIRAAALAGSCSVPSHSGAPMEPAIEDPGVARGRRGSSRTRGICWPCTRAACRPRPPPASACRGPVIRRAPGSRRMRCLEAAARVVDADVPRVRGTGPPRVAAGGPSRDPRCLLGLSGSDVAAAREPRVCFPLRCSGRRLPRRWRARPGPGRPLPRRLDHERDRGVVQGRPGRRRRASDGRGGGVRHARVPAAGAAARARAGRTRTGGRRTRRAIEKSAAVGALVGRLGDDRRGAPTYRSRDEPGGD